MEKTKNNSKYTVNFCLAYGGREEVVDATKKLMIEAKEGSINPEDLDIEKFKEYLYMPDEPDLVIRTSGEKRTSNFLIFQAYYSEWFFVEKMWPEFSKEDLKEVIDSYMNRERRFGK